MSYREVQPTIAKYARGSAEGMLDVLTFVYLTVRQPIESLPAAFADVRKRGGASVYLWGKKRAAFDYLQGNSEQIFLDLQKLETTLERLVYVATLPGFGLPKAGFVLQLVWGEAGCLDTHNLTRYGIPWNSDKARIKGRKRDTQLRKAESYLKLCEGLGGPEILWDSWCQYISELRPSVGTWQEVSALHACFLPAQSSAA